MVPKAKKIWMDGKLVNWDEAQVHVLTHTLHYGVGVFEMATKPWPDCSRCAMLSSRYSS